MNGVLEHAAPAIAMLAAFALVIGGVTLIRRRNPQKGVLMLVMALVLVGNVVIWTM
jgi:hypothetical protein